MRRYLLPLAALCALLAAGCTTSPPPAVAMPSAPVGMPQETDKVPIAPDTPQRAAQLPRTVIDYDHALLTDDERRVVARLIDASKQIDEIFLRQVSEDNPSMRDRLAKQAAAPSATPLDRAGYDYFIINKGPWDRLQGGGAVRRHREEAGRRGILSRRHHEVGARAVRGRPSEEKRRARRGLPHRPPRRHRLR